MRVTSEQSCIALRAFLTLPSMLSSAPFGEHGDNLWTLKTFSRPSTTTANWLTHNYSPLVHSIKNS
jgi:hypothetical protein